MARTIPVRAANPNVICIISSEQEIPLSEANHIMDTFIKSMKEVYGENVFPSDTSEVFRFNLSVDENGRITSALPTLHEIGNAKGYWSKVFQTFLRIRAL